MNRPDNHGATALLTAAGNGRTAAVTVLISAKANLNSKTLSGRTPLHEGETPLHVATSRRLAAIAWIVGAIRLSTDIFSDTQLHVASRARGALETLTISSCGAGPVTHRGKLAWGYTPFTLLPCSETRQRHSYSWIIGQMCE